jgi:replicative DNA helicase
VLSSRSRISQRKLFQGRLDSQQQDAITAASKEICPVPILLEDGAPSRQAEIEAVIESARRAFEQQQQSLDLVVFDAIEAIFEAPVRRRTLRRVGALLRSIATRFGVAVLAKCTLTECSHGCAPDLEALPAAPIPARFSDAVALLHRVPAASARDDRAVEVELSVAQNRLGPTGRQRMLYFVEEERFEPTTS